MSLTQMAALLAAGSCHLRTGQNELSGYECDGNLECGPGILDEFRQHLVWKMEEEVLSWCNTVTRLTDFENDKLLDEPTRENLDAYRKLMLTLRLIGRGYASAAKVAESPVAHLAEMIEAHLESLDERERLFLGPRMSKAESDRVLAQVFGDAV